MLKNNKHNLWLSFTKWIAACFIVFIHVRFPGKPGEIIDCISRFGVPFFFLTSGYYCFKSENSQIKKRIKKIVYLYLIASITYLVWNLIYILSSDGSIQDYLTKVFSIKSAARLIFLGISPVGASHLWYLSSIFYIYVLLLIIIKFWDPAGKYNYSALYIFAMGSYLCHILMAVKAQGASLSVSFLIYRNAIFFGIPMFVLGLFLHEYQDRIMLNFSFSTRKAVLLIISGFVLSLIQWFGIGKTEMPLGMILVVINLFLLAVTKENGKSEKRYVSVCAKILENGGIILYIIHPLINNIFTALAEHKKSYESFIHMNVYPLYIFLISCIISIIVSSVIYFLSKYNAKNRMNPVIQ